MAPIQDPVCGGLLLPHQSQQRCVIGVVQILESARHSAARTVLELKGLLKSKQELTVRHKYELFENKSFEELLALKQQLLEGSTEDIPYEETDKGE